MAGYDKEAYKIEAEARRKDLTEKLKTGMIELYNSDEYKNYLKVMAQFPQYSYRNIMLIKKQMPGATRVASKRLWEKEFKRHPRKGSKALYIYAPTGGKKPETKEFEVIDPETNAPKLDENGNVITEELTTLGSGPGFRLVPVFDVSQTRGEPLPELIQDFAGRVENYYLLVEALENVSPLPIAYKPLPSNVDGICIFNERIEIREGMSEAQTIAAMVHEITHAKLHDIPIIDDTAEKKPLSVMEIEAESIAYVVCQRFGIETGANSFGHLAQWSNHDKDIKQLNASLDIIRKEAGALMNDISNRLNEICKERGIDINAEAIEPDQTPNQPEPAPVKPQEPNLITETHTENIAGVDFSFHAIVDGPVTDVEALALPSSSEEPPKPGEKTDDEVVRTRGWDEYVADVCRESADVVEPFVIIKYSENPEFTTLERLSFNDADAKFKEAEARLRDKRTQEDYVGHDKTDVAVFYKANPEDTELSAYVLRYDIGDYDKNDSGLYNHINNFWNHQQSQLDSGNHSSFTQETINSNRKMLSILQASLNGPQHDEPVSSTEPSVSATPIVVPKNEVPVYKHDVPTARENGELDAYKQSNKLNYECGQAIDQAIRDSNFELHRYDLKTAAKTVIDQYGPERVAHVLAANIQAAEWDGRLSDSTKAWAKGIDIPVDPKVYLQSHPTLLEGFTKRFREAEKEKPSVLATLEANAQKANRQAASKSVPIQDAQTKKPGQEAI